MKRNKNDIITVEITDLNNLGCGVGRDSDGVVVFVNGAVTADVVKARLIKINKNYLVAKPEEFLRYSPFRSKKNFCDAPLSCGGCVYRSVTRECELSMKQSYLENLFKKAGLSEIKILPIMTVGNREGYRNKAQYPVRNGKTGVEAGFFAAKTHNVVNGGKCMLEPPVFNEIVELICAFCNEKNIKAYDETSGEGVVRHIYLRMGWISREIMVCLVINCEKMPYIDELISRLCKKISGIVSIMLNVNKENTNVITGKRYYTVFGKPYIEDILGTLKFKITPDAFWQVNHNGAELIYRIAEEKAGLDGSQNLLDLFCGTGTIGLFMAKKCKSITGVEIVPGAVECAKFNAANNNIKNAEFYCADATETENIIPSNKNFDVVVLDPPRKGVPEKLIKFIASKNIPKIIYISCSPDTLARDIVIFKAQGYIAKDVQPVDIFPVTGHVESVVLMSRVQK